MIMSIKTLVSRGSYYVVVVLLLILCVVFFLDYKKGHAAIEQFSDGAVWTLTMPDGSVYENVDLQSNSLHYALKEGERMRIETTLDNDYQGELTARVFTRQAALQAYVNDKAITGYDHEVDAHAFLGNGYQFVTIPIVGRERTLRFEVIGGRGNQVNSVPNIILTRSREAYGHFLSEHMFLVYCGIFLLVLGVIITCIGSVSFAIDKEYFPLVLVGLIGVLSGVWSITNIKAIELFSNDLARNTLFEYLALYLLPAPILQFVRYRYAQLKKNTRLINIGTVVILVFAVVSVVLHASGTVYITDLLVVFHALLLAAIGIVLGTGCKLIKDMERFEYYYLAAFGIGILSAIVYVVRYQMSRLFGFGGNTVNMSYLTVAILAFEMLLVFGYLGFMRGRVVSRVEHDVLEQMAYEDQMTGLYNRAKGELLMRQLNDRSTGEPYAIINFDMNGLKRTNDTLGHFSGDAMLVRFAEILTQSFHKIGTAVRMSGDEFIVVVRGMDNIQKIDDALQDLLVAEAEVSEEADYTMDAAYGIARSMEFLEPNSERVYRLADERMYQMKTASKKGRA